MADPHDVITRALIESQVRNRDDARFAARVVLRALRDEFGCRSCDTFGTWHDRIVLPVANTTDELASGKPRTHPIDYKIGGSA